MTRPGLAAAFEIHRSDAIGLPVFLFQDSAPIDPRMKYWDLYGEHLIQFLVKLYRAGKRKRIRQGDTVRVGTLLQAEAEAGFLYLAYRFFSPHASEYPVPERVFTAAYALWRSLARDVLRARGRPKLTYAKAEALLEQYRSAATFERNDHVSGTTISAARTRIRELEAALSTGLDGREVDDVMGESVTKADACEQISLLVDVLRTRPKIAGLFVLESD